MGKAQQRNKEDIDKRVWSSKETSEPRGFVFVRKGFYGPHNEEHNLDLVTKAPFRVVSTTDITVVVQIDRKQVRLSRDRVMTALAVRELMRRDVLWERKHDILHERTEEEVTAESIDDAQGNKKHLTSLLVDH